jgi:hypothetical protein
MVTQRGTSGGNLILPFLRHPKPQGVARSNQAARRSMRTARLHDSRLAQGDAGQPATKMPTEHLFPFGGN